MATGIQLAAASTVDILSAVARIPGGGTTAMNGVKDAINRVYSRSQDAGLLERLPTFDQRYVDYPELRVFERRYPEIRQECEELLRQRERLTDIKALGGDYTAGGIHTIRWKAFMFKAGRFIESNCALAPRTAEILRSVPNVYNAFFSIIEPRQYVTPHFGYYKGFVRYHLGVLIPDDNAENKCWLRVNADPADNALRDKKLIERGEKHYWKNGRGFIFDDTNLHDAANECDETRVVLWLDVVRKMRPALALYNRAILSALYLEPSFRKIREKARVDLTQPTAAR
jgi:aspartyl/asparaginyl beta-hydroxylase (cupin superfamily)